MVFCVIFVFGTLLEFTILIFLQKQVFATRLQRSLTALTMAHAAQREGSITSGGQGGGMTAAAIGMAGLFGGLGPTAAPEPPPVPATSVSPTMPRHDCGIIENDSNANGANDRVQLTATTDAKSGRVVAAQQLGKLNANVTRINPLETIYIYIYFACKALLSLQKTFFTGSTPSNNRNNQRAKPRSGNYDFYGGSSMKGNNISLQPMNMGLAPSIAAQIAAGVRRDMSVDTMDNTSGEMDPEYQSFLAEEQRQREILFTIERYGIVVFAIFFIFFNIFYWLHLLHSQIF